MEFDVLVEPSVGGGYVARSRWPFDLTTEGATEAEAVGAIRRLARARVISGAHVVRVPMAEDSNAAELPTEGVVTGPPPGANPWTHMAGVFKDDPTFEDFLRAIEQYRDEIEADPNR